MNFDDHQIFYVAKFFNDQLSELKGYNWNINYKHLTLIPIL